MKKEAFFILTFYVLMGIMNYITVAIDLRRILNPSGMFMNYLLKALLTIPLLWIYFRKLSSQVMWKKGVLHFITMPLFTFVWIKFYYSLCDAFGLFRLQGSQEIWDVYLTVLFYCIQFGFFHLYVYSNKLKTQELLSAELSRLNAESKLSALKAQLNPHFLYNIFNTINAAIPTSAKNARNMINELSDLFRYQLKASRAKLISLNEELIFVRKYLDLEKERFDDRLDYEMKIDPGIEEFLIPPIILQPLVENAIKHGISPLIEGGKITICVRHQENKLNFTVRDTGIGIKDKVKKNLLSQGVGLSNTNERLLKMYGMGLGLSENIDGGLCVSFSIPIDN